MEEAAIADKIIVINKGVIVAEGTPEELRLKYSNDKLIIIPDGAQAYWNIRSLSQGSRSFPSRSLKPVLG